MTSAKPPGPGFRDWALFAVSMTFVAMGAFLMRKEPREALMPLTFFGACAITFGISIHRKLRRRRFAATSVAVAGGVPLRRSAARMLLLAVMIAVPGIAIFIAPAPLLIQACGVVMLGASAWLLFAVFTGRVSSGFLRFDPRGLTFGGRDYEVLLPWDAVVDVSEFEMVGNAAVRIAITDTSALDVTPAGQRDRVLRACARNFGLNSAQFVLLAAHYNVPAENLAAAIRQYVTHPGARADLVAHSALTIQRARQ